MLDLECWHAGFNMLAYSRTARPADTTTPPPLPPPLDGVAIYTAQEHAIQHK